MIPVPRGKAVDRWAELMCRPSAAATDAPRTLPSQYTACLRENHKIANNPGS